MKSDLISIVVPVYNQRGELDRALASIFDQTHKNIEVIVVDDGSFPEVRSTKYEVRLIRQENRGAPAARNKGLTEAKGEYVIFWDADIVAKPDFLQKMLQALEANLGVAYAYCNFYFGRKKMPSRNFDTEALKQNNYIPSTSLVRRADAILWDESLTRFQDWDLWLTMASQGKSGVWVDEYLWRAETKGTMSRWLPKFAYKKPWRYLPGIKAKVESYEKAKLLVINKHQLKPSL